MKNPDAYREINCNKTLKMSKFTKVFENSYNELMHKVTWPSWPALQQSTIVVLIGFLIITLILFGMDGVAEFIFEKFYEIFK